MEKLELLGEARGEDKSFKGITFIPSKKFVTPKDIQAGMFEYANGLIYPELIQEEQLRGIVGSVDDLEILVWCLRAQKLYWASSHWLASTLDEKMRGWEATQIILKTAKTLGETAPAAEYCVNYAFDGAEKGEAFLASCADYEKLIFNLEKVKAVYMSLKLGVFGYVLWSSSERSTSWVSNFCVHGRIGFSYDYKARIDTVRPVRRIVR